MNTVRLFLCGDVMTGRGVDQILRHPSDPRLEEESINDARHYVELAEAINGPIPRSVEDRYIWGDALAILERVAPDARVINLETSITRCEREWPGKQVHYRMQPENVGCLTAASIDVCALANNHVLDYGREGLVETLATLHGAGLRTAGAGLDFSEARQPAEVTLGSDQRLLVFSVGSTSSGIPEQWAATEASPGIDLLPDLSEDTALDVTDRVHRSRRPQDVVVVSIHWGTNWGYKVPDEQRRFARLLIDGGVDVVHGHSSHHGRPIEVYRDKLVLYGCGNCIDDYEGISGFEEFRSDLALLYCAEIEPGAGALRRLLIAPMQIRNYRLRQASPTDAQWLRHTIEQISPGAILGLTVDGMLTLRQE